MSEPEAEEAIRDVRRTWDGGYTRGTGALLALTCVEEAKCLPQATHPTKHNLYERPLGAIANRHQAPKPFPMPLAPSGRMTSPKHHG